MNDCKFFGRLTRDPELRYTPNGTAVADFSMAINETWKDKDGGKKESTTFLEFVVWNGRAETLTKYAKKGQRLLVSAKAKQDVWEDKDTGAKRSKVKFQVNEYHFVDFADKPAQLLGKSEEVDDSDDSDTPF